MIRRVIIFILLGEIGRIYCDVNRTFPDGFMFGVATSSYQTEGAWNVSGKGESMYDVFLHENPEVVLDRSNGDVACDSYHKYEEDIKNLKYLGVDFYRFSLSWSRIFPKGHPYKVNQNGLNYYSKILDLLAANNITAMVTLFHWDLPQPLMTLGGLSNEKFVTYFLQYSKVAFENFGNRVKYWLTFNEPYQICMFGYGQKDLAPAIGMSGIADYICGHNLLKAHAAVYHLYDDTYRSKFGGEIAITVSARWFEPNKTEDEEAAERMRQFVFGIHMNPIFSSEGGYPDVVKSYVAERSKLEGYSISRLPQFTQDEIESIRGTYDFLGLNHYTTLLATNQVNDIDDSTTSIENDHQVLTWFDSSWQVDEAGRSKFTPWGLRKLLVWLKNAYNDPKIFITENGCADNGKSLIDTTRISYYGQYLEAALEAVHEDKVNLMAYTFWSFMDNFEWFDGYTVKFGLFHVDFTDPNRTRTPKSSATFLKNLISNRTLIDY